MPEWEDNLIDDLARRRVVLFLGAGVSRNSVAADNKTRPPLWGEFLTKCLASLKKPKAYVKALLRSGDYLTAAEIMKKNLDNEWFNLLRRSFVDPKYKATDIHRHVYRLDARVCLTQNVDKIYDTYAQSESQNTVLVKQHFDKGVANAIRGDARCIIKAHGTIDEPVRMIFTRSEYAKARHEHQSFYALLDALALTHTFLFIGAGIADPDVQMMLERMAQMHPEARPHYMLVSSGSIHADHADALRRNMNLKVIWYKASKTHHHLTTMLADLADVVEERRDVLAETRDW